MNKINFAILICSVEYRNIIHSVLQKNEVIFHEALAGNTNDRNFLQYVKTNTNIFSDYEAVIIDIGALADSAEEIIEAIESLRYYDDSIRIVVVNGRDDSYKIMHECFLNGIYNLIYVEEFVALKEKLEKCILNGMSYKDALVFRDEEDIGERKTTKKEPPKIIHQNIIYIGSQHRIGLTHSVILSAYTLRKAGYLVAVVDCTSTCDILKLKNMYDIYWRNEGCSFELENIDFYVKPSGKNSSLPGDEYNFVLYDMGAYGGVLPGEKEIITQADERIIVSGAKPWELSPLKQLLDELAPVDEGITYKYLFNFVAKDMQADIKKMMNNVGVADKNVFFLENTPDFFAESDVVRKLTGIEVESVKRKKWFGRK